MQRRVDILEAEGIKFVTNAAIGDGANGSRDARQLAEEYDAVLLATGATTPRDLPVEGRQLEGVHFAMEYLTASTKTLLDSGTADGAPINARGKHVIVIGGGDTGTDCIGTALRHGCKSLVNFEIMAAPPASRAANNPWPSWPRIMRVDYGHDEAIGKFGKDPRRYLVSGKGFSGGNGHVESMRTVQIKWEGGRPAEVPGTEREWEADLVLLAMGFLGPEHQVSEALGIELEPRSNYKAAYGHHRTSHPKVYAAGDCRRGQSLVVRAIDEGRLAAAAIDRDLAAE